MANNTDLFDYLIWRGDITIENDSFNEIDGMILARFVYLPFEYIFKKNKDRKVTIYKACSALLSLNKLEEKVLDECDIQLMEALRESARFRDMQLFNYVNNIDEIEETQFCGITIQMASDLYGIIYRGTDNTIIGWKENFNMGFISPIACQKHGLEYLEESAKALKGDFIIAGHSKGGNISAYAAALCGDEIQNRIRAVYDYDGPGFVESVLQEEGYHRIKDKIYTFVPQASLVGMLLGHNEECKIIHSSEYRGPYQHNVYSWDVIGKSFIPVNDTTSGSKNFDSAMKNWLMDMEVSKREEFVEGVYSIFTNVDATTLMEMKSNWFACTKVILSAVANMDEDTKKTVNEGIKLFMKSVKNAIVSDENKA